MELSSDTSWSNHCCNLQTCPASSANGQTFNSNFSILELRSVSCRDLASHSLHIDCTSPVSDCRSSMYSFLVPGTSWHTADASERVAKSVLYVTLFASTALNHDQYLSRRVSTSDLLLNPRAQLHRDCQSTHQIYRSLAGSTKNQHAIHPHGRSLKELSPWLW